MVGRCATLEVVVGAEMVVGTLRGFVVVGAGTVVGTVRGIVVGVVASEDTGGLAVGIRTVVGTTVDGVNPVASRWWVPVLSNMPLPARTTSTIREPTISLYRML